MSWHCPSLAPTLNTTAFTPATLPPSPTSLSHHTDNLFKHILKAITQRRRETDQSFGVAYQSSPKNDTSFLTNTPYMTNYKATYHDGDTHISQQLGGGRGLQRQEELCIYYNTEDSRGAEDKMFPSQDATADTQLSKTVGSEIVGSLKTRNWGATQPLVNTTHLNPVDSNYKPKDHKSRLKQTTLHSLGRGSHLKERDDVVPKLNQVCGKQPYSHFDGNRESTRYLNQRELQTLPEKLNSREHIGGKSKSGDHHGGGGKMIDVGTLCEERLREIELEITEVKEVAAVLCYHDGSSQLRVAQTRQPKRLSEIEGVCLAYPTHNQGSEVLTLQTIFIPFATEDAALWTWSKRQLLTLLCHARVISYGAKDLAVAFFDHFHLPSSQVWRRWSLLDVGVGVWLLSPDQETQSFHQLLVKFGVKIPPSAGARANEHEQSDGRSQLCHDIALLGPLIVEVYQCLKDRGLWSLFIDMEVRLIPLLAAMEHSGVQIDCDLLLKNADLLKVKITRVESEAHKAAGHTFQINSHAQLRQVLFDELCLDEKCKKKLSKTQVLRQKSTSEAVLSQLKDLHPLPALVLEYRQLCKLNATYISGILPFIKQGVLKPRWIHTGSATGRIVSCNPNIQAFPKQPLNLGVVHKQFVIGKEDVEENIEQRKVVKSRSGYTFVAADFKSIELCIMAHLSGDPVLIETLQHSLGNSSDIFNQLSSEWLGLKVDDVSPSDREQTKRVVYAILYGVGKEKLGDMLNIHPSCAKELINSFLAKFTGVQTFIARTIIECREKGYLETISGRKRWFSQINAVNQQLRAQSERQAVNFPIQGSAADVCKWAMIKVVEMLSQESPATRILVQIHDELLFEVPDDDVISVAEKIKCVLESSTLLSTTLKVPLRVRVTAGQTWADLNPLLTS